MDQTVGEFEGLQVFGGEAHGIRVEIAGADQAARGLLHAGAGTFAQLFVQRAEQGAVVDAQLVDAEVTVEPRGAVAEHLGSFDDQGAGAAEGVEQRGGPVPAREGEQAGGQVFLQGGGHAIFGAVAPATLEEGFAGEIQIELQAFGREEGADAHVRVMGVHRGALAALVAEAVDDGILDAQGGEVQAAQRGTVGHHVDAQCLAGIEPVFPRQGVAEPVQGVLAGAGGIEQAQQDTAGQAGFEVDAVGEPQVAAAAHAAGGRGDVAGAQCLQFARQRLFEAARAGAEVAEDAGVGADGGGVGTVGDGAAGWALCAGRTPRLLFRGNRLCLPGRVGFGGCRVGGALDGAEVDHGNDGLWPVVAARQGKGLCEWCPVHGGFVGACRLLHPARPRRHWGTNGGQYTRGYASQKGFMTTMATTMSSRMTGASLKTRNHRSERVERSSANFCSRRPQPWW